MSDSRRRGFVVVWAVATVITLTIIAIVVLAMALGTASE